MSSGEYDIVIVGGGAAGLMAAAVAAGKKCRVALLEKNTECGRKMLITGKGRCNITNSRKWEDFKSHIYPDSNFFRPSFMAFSNDDTVEFLNSMGLKTVEERGMRVFPLSGRSSDVRDALVSHIHRGGNVSLFTGTEVLSVNPRPKGGFDITALFLGNRMRAGHIAARCVIIATGGLSYPGTGSTGDGYGWARQFRHNVRTCFPSLTAIVPEGYKDMSGAGQADSGSGLKGHIDRSVPLSETGSLLNGNQLKNVSLALYIDGACVQEEFGDMDFTDGGIEGSIGFKVSRRCVNAVMNGSKVSISIDLKPAVSADALDKRIRSLWQEIAEDRRSIEKSYNDRFRVLLGKLLPASLVQGFRRCNQGIDHKTLAARLKNWKMNIRGFVGYERCVITAGGISTDEINARKMESKLCPGLYFAGEIIDLDGDTGGYNLQTAFSTGMLAGQSAARSLILP